VLGPYSSSNSRFSLAAESRGLRGRRPPVLALRDAAAVSGRRARGRKGKRKEKSPNEEEKSL
jgi:hypothetical protein